MDPHTPHAPTPRHRAARTTALASALLLVVLSAAWSVPARADGSDGSGGASGGHPGRMMLVLDSSGSMKEPASGGMSKIAAAKKALGEVVDGLPADADVGMRVYGATVFSKGDQGACTDSQEVVQPGTGNRAALRKAIGKYQPYGETPTGYALQQAAKDLGSEGKRSIVLVSDGEATCKPDPCQVASKLARQGINLHIDVVGLGVSGKARSQLQCVAAKGNGTYYGVDSAEEIVKSLSHVARRDVRPFTLEGTPIEGSLDASSPTPISQGVWTDTVPAYQAEQNTLHYVYTRTIADSTLHVSAVTLGQPDSEDTIAVHISTPSGEVCDKDNALRQVVNSGPLAAEAISQAGDPDDVSPGCAKDKSLLVDVSRIMGVSHQAAPVQLLVAEEPPVSNADDLPGAYDGDPSLTLRHGGRPQPVTGGGSFPDAPLLQPGAYTGTTVPGEATMFRVHLDWGQRLVVRFDFPKATGALADVVGWQGPFVSTTIYDPLRAAVDGDVRGVQGTHFASSSASAGYVDAATYPVRYHNRSMAGTYSALAGDYYVGLDVDRDYDHRMYELPYTVHVQVLGKPAGAPAYEDHSGWTVQQALAANTSSAPGDGGEEGDRSGDEGHTGKYLAVGVLVVAALGCAGVGVALLRRRSVS